MRGLLLLFFSISSAVAQNALYVDISGEWRKSANDSPRYSEPSFDDSAWMAVQLPWTKLPPTGIYWVRRSVELPSGTDHSRLAITLGEIAESYELFVNGRQVAIVGGLSSAQAQIARPRSFAIAPEATEGQRSLQISVRLWRQPRQFGTFSWWRFKDGPYLLTYREHIPAGISAMGINRTQLEISPRFLLAVLLALFAVVLFLGWTTDRQNMAMLWFAAFLSIASTMGGYQFL